MKSFLHFIIIVFSSIALSCCSNNTSTKNSEAEFYMVSWENLYWENLYRFYDEREDTLLNGLTNVNKEVRRYSDGSKKVVMGLIIDESDSLTGPYTRCVYLDAAEISKFDAFIDSCCSKPQKRNERWELQLKSGAIFSYDEYNKTIAFWCDQGRYVGLQITPQRFKEALSQIMEDEAFRVDD